MKFFIYLALICKTLTIDYKKNTDILMSKKFPHSRLKEIEDLNFLLEKIESQSTMMVLFHADWCHHCKEFLPKFETSSKYELSDSFEFYSVNCKNKALCEHFNVNKFPTTKVFIKGKDINEEPPRETEALLEFIEKITSSPIIKLKKKGIENFSKNYGEVNFLLLEKDENSQFYKCILNLAETEYLPLLYFGHIKTNTYQTLTGKTLNSPALITLGSNVKYDLFLQANYENITCNQVKEFIDINKYPLLKRLTMSFIRRLQAEKKTLIIAIIDSKSKSNQYFLNNSFKSIALLNRNYVFSHLDYDEDKDILSHLRVSKSENPVVAIYNFEIRRFYVDKFVYLQDGLENENHLNTLINSINNNELKYSAGNWIEDLLESFGIQLNHNTILVLFIGTFASVCIVFMIIIFYSGEKNANEEMIQKIKKEQTENVENIIKNETKKMK